MAENVLIALKRKREAGTFNNDTVWDSRARKELASNWSDYVEPGNEFDDSVAELRQGNLISTGLCDELQCAGAPPVCEQPRWCENQTKYIQETTEAAIQMGACG